MSKRRDGTDAAFPEKLPISVLNEGWIKIHRSILLHPVFQDSELLHLFLYCIAKANHRDSRLLWKGDESTLKRGQFLFGRKKASKETGIKQSSVYRRLMILKNLEMVDVQSNNKFSTVTVLNYGKYQDVPPQIEQQVNRGVTANQHEEITKIQNPDSKQDNPLLTITLEEQEGYDDESLFSEQQSGQQLNNN
ncbi:MAG: hypothetical protein M1469_01505 [Bacteroidetes bacterium]|nr:hypothetical protein [Bacteroidota bacterium]